MSDSIDNYRWVMIPGRFPPGGEFVCITCDEMATPGFHECDFSQATVKRLKAEEAVDRAWENHKP